MASPVVTTSCSMCDGSGNAFQNWLVRAPDLSVRLPALVFRGPAGTGKTLLAKGIEHLFTSDSGDFALVDEASDPVSLPFGKRIVICSNNAFKVSNPSLGLLEITFDDLKIDGVRAQDMLRKLGAWKRGHPFGRGRGEWRLDEKAPDLLRTGGYPVCLASESGTIYGADVIAQHILWMEREAKEAAGDRGVLG